ncbi:MAG: heparinase II/III family protein, partial [Bryobacteraceae bacterium]
EADTEIAASVRAFGRGSAGHSHAHALHFTLRRAGEPVLIDPGTYTYISDPVWRDRFRGTAAHNTIRIDARDQADPAGPFGWSNIPLTEIVDFQASPWRLHARCRYRGLSHERRMAYSDGALWVIDEISGAGRHKLEQFWHAAGPIEKLADGSMQLRGGLRLIVPEKSAVEIQEGGEFGWSSPVPGLKQASPVIRVSLESELPCRMVAVLDSHGESAPLRVEKDFLALGDRKIRI